VSYDDWESRIPEDYDCPQDTCHIRDCSSPWEAIVEDGPRLCAAHYDEWARAKRSLLAKMEEVADRMGVVIGTEQ
jgi:hypothetical protein